MNKKQLFSNRTVFSEKTERIGKKILLGFVGLIVLFYFFINSGDNPNSNNHKVVNNNSVRQFETLNVKSAVKLASLEIGYNDPTQELVDKFQNLLNELSLKCPNESEEQLAGYIFIGRKTIEEKLGSITLFAVGNGIKESIPDEAIGIISCAEVASAFVALTISN